MQKKVLVVDDSPPVRRVLRALLEREGYVVALAEDGVEAVKAVESEAPALVILDLNMPNMDGFEALSKIRALDATLPVLVFSAHTNDGADESLEALARGATGWVSKPTTTEKGQTPLRQLQDSLLPQVRAFVGRKVPSTPAPRRPSATLSSQRPVMPATSSKGIVAIGVSTGGPNALASLLVELPGTLPVPIVIVQHMPPEYTRSLAHRLDRDSALHVVEGFQGMHVLPGVVYIAPGGVHMVLERSSSGVRTIQLVDKPPVNNCKPAVDPMFESVARLYGQDAIGVVLTGMGADGCAGARVLKESGAHLIAQDEATSVVWGMPGSIVKAKLQDEVLPLGDIAARITGLCTGAAMRRGA